MHASHCVIDKLLIADTVKTLARECSSNTLRVICVEVIDDPGDNIVFVVEREGGEVAVRTAVEKPDILHLLFSQNR